MGKAHRALTFLVFFIFVSAGITIFAKMFGHHILPSTEWAGMTRYLSPLFGVLVAVLVIFFMRATARLTGGGIGIWKLIGVGFLGFLMGMITVTGFIPMTARFVAGQETQLVYVVRRASGIDNRCATPIKLRDLPITFDSLCGFGQNLQRSLTPGQTIIVTGKGTWMGILPQSVVPMPSRENDG